MFQKFSFKNFSVFIKIASITVLVCLMVSAIIAFYIVPIIKNQVFAERKAGLKNIVTMAHTTLTNFNRMAAKGEITLEEAKLRSKNRINAFRYGNNEKDYLFVTDIKTGKAVVHPANPNLNGKNVTGIQDKKGKYIIKEAILSAQNGNGFIDYFWTRPGSEELFPKVSYIQIYDPWGWAIITGVYVDDVNQTVQTIMIKIFAAFALVFGLALAVTLFIARKITIPLKQGAKFAEKVANGDLTQSMRFDQQDEVGELVGSLNRMVEKLAKIFTSLSVNSDALSSSSTELAAISDQLKGASSENAASVSTISSAIEGLNNGISSISEALEDSISGAGEVADAAGQMNASVTDISRTTEEVNTTTLKAVADVESALETITELGRAADEIDKVSLTITDISDQTNLLALNATIEAARAGQAGKGFAVVATEIKALAAETGSATGAIDEQVKWIQNATTKAIGKINQIHEVIHEINKSVSMVKDALADQSGRSGIIAQAVVEIQAGITRISSSLSDVAENSKAIADDAGRVDTNIGETNQGIGQLNSSAEIMSQMSEELTQAINTYRF